MATPDRNVLIAQLTELLKEIVGEDLLDEVEIGPETSFQDDLELESIEFVALAEAMETQWGDTVDFAGWLGTLELDAILQLKIGDVADHVARALNGE